MNEQILELAKQAGLKFPSETALSPQELKFAELVVLACANRLTQNDFSSVKGVMLIAGAKLKEHFGVEE
jgi:hypothetical protein